MLTPGSIVRLKSGGPDMTITEIVNAVAICSWLDEHDSTVSAQFPLETLNELKPKESLGEKLKHGVEKVVDAVGEGIGEAADSR